MLYIYSIGKSNAYYAYTHKYKSVKSKLWYLTENKNHLYIVIFYTVTRYIDKTNSLF